MSLNQTSCFMRSTIIQMQMWISATDKAQSYRDMFKVVFKLAID